MAKPSLVPSGSGGRPRSSVTTAGSCSRSSSIACSAVAGDDHAIAVIGPFQLALQAFVVLDDQQDGKVGIVQVGHARFRLGSARRLGGRQVDGEAAALAGRLSTVRRPPIAAISERASKAPMPKPPALVETKGWNRRLRMKSASMPAAAVDDARSPPRRRRRATSDHHRLRRPGWPRSRSGRGGRPPARAPAASATAHSDCVAAQAHVMVAVARRRSPLSRIGVSGCGSGFSGRAPACGGEAGEQVVHLADRALAASRPCRRGTRDCRRAARHCGRPATTG